MTFTEKLADETRALYAALRKDDGIYSGLAERIVEMYAGTRIARHFDPNAPLNADEQGE